MTAPARPRCTFVVPGDWHTPTGGYRYDRRIAEALREAGWDVELCRLDAGFPWPDASARADAARRIAALPDGTLAVADGLAFGVLPELAAQHARRLRWVALVHHPLHLETGVDAAARDGLREQEGRALAAARQVIVTSAATARDLAHFAVPPPRVAVVEPGTDAAPLATGAADGVPNLLCVATLTPRKGHAVLLEALAGLASLDWRLHCVGSLQRDPGTARGLRRSCVELGLGDRVQWHGEVDEATLQRHFAAADLFVLPSYHEGYGMAVAEALARGLPVVATTGGALAQTLPPAAGLQVPPGDVEALCAALRRLIGDPSARAACAAGAREARERLPSWAEAGERFAHVLQGVA